MKYEDFLLFERKPGGVMFVTLDRREATSATKQSLDSWKRVAGPLLDNPPEPTMQCVPDAGADAEVREGIAAWPGERPADFRSARLS